MIARVEMFLKIQEFFLCVLCGSALNIFRVIEPFFFVDIVKHA